VVNACVDRVAASAAVEKRRPPTDVMVQVCAKSESMKVKALQVQRGTSSGHQINSCVILDTVTSPRNYHPGVAAGSS
jgi:hypothetical protein